MKQASTVIKRIRKLAQEFPNALYTPVLLPDKDWECSYSKGEVSNGPQSSGCIVGQACKGYATIPKAHDLKSVPELFEDDTFEINYSAAEVSWLSNVQFAQDTGKTWEKAVKYADKMNILP